jgi:hypothetical protein
VLRAHGRAHPRLGQPASLVPFDAGEGVAQLLFGGVGQRAGDTGLGADDAWCVADHVVHVAGDVSCTRARSAETSRPTMVPSSHDSVSGRRTESTGRRKPTARVGEAARRGRSQNCRICRSDKKGIAWVSHGEDCSAWVH